MNRGNGAEPRNNNYNIMYLTGQNTELSSAEITNDTGADVGCISVEDYYTLSQTNRHLVDMQNSVFCGLQK